jgi:hypothetical protein
VRLRQSNSPLSTPLTPYAHEGLPDGGYFGENSKFTSTPLRAIWLCTFISILPGLLDLASPIAANAIFSLCAIALDTSYIIPIFLRRVCHDHPDVMFKPGPFNLGNGFLGKFCNWICIFWTLFVCVIFSFPTVLPVTGSNMNYSSVCCVGSSIFGCVHVLMLSMYDRSYASAFYFSQGAFFHASISPRT